MFTNECICTKFWDDAKLARRDSGVFFSFRVRDLLAGLFGDQLFGIHCGLEKENSMCPYVGGLLYAMKVIFVDVNIKIHIGENPIVRAPRHLV